MKHNLPVLFALLLAGCGASETASTAATVGAAKAKEAEQAQQTLEKIQNQLDQSAKEGEKRVQGLDAGYK